jgi:hypothetical protein
MNIIFNIVSLLFNTLYCCTSFLMPSEKNVFSWVASQVCLNASSSGPDKWWWQGEKSEIYGNKQLPQTWVSWGFLQCGRKYVDGHCHATTQLFSTGPFKLQVLACKQAVMVTVYCCAPLPIIFQCWALRVTKKCKHKFSWIWLLNFFLLVNCGCFLSILYRLQPGSPDGSVFHHQSHSLPKQSKCCWQMFVYATLCIVFGPILQTLCNPSL